MESFPASLNVGNKEQFTRMLFEYHLSQLRRDIMYHMLHGKENDFFDLDRFNRTHVKNMKIMTEMTAIVATELKELGWTTYLGFGDTGLYVYSSTEKPDGVY
jgi:hypothetical protein